MCVALRQCTSRALRRFVLRPGGALHMYVSGTLAVLYLHLLQSALLQFVFLLHFYLLRINFKNHILYTWGLKLGHIFGDTDGLIYKQTAWSWKLEALHKGPEARAGRGSQWSHRVLLSIQYFSPYLRHQIRKKEYHALPSQGIDTKRSTIKLSFFSHFLLTILHHTSRNRGKKQCHQKFVLVWPSGRKYD